MFLTIVTIVSTNLKHRIFKKNYPYFVLSFFSKGETSSGKSSIINLLLEKKILPTGIKACTSRVCRVKYSERLSISTRNKNDEELSNTTFKNTNDMATTLEILAKTKDPLIRYIDIMIPGAFVKVIVYPF